MIWTSDGLFAETSRQKDSIFCPVPSVWVDTPEDVLVCRLLNKRPQPDPLNDTVYFYSSVNRYSSPPLDHQILKMLLP